MKSASWPYRAVRVIFTTLLITAALPHVAAAVTNEWTKSTSGYWEEPYWSLGVLPSMQHDAIVFANPGYKALAIGPSTRAFPDSLSIRNLIVEEPSNLLLLNYAGLDTPLRVASDFVLGRDASLLSYYSSLVASNFYCSGKATFAELSTATFNKLQVNALAPINAELVISNAALTAEEFHVGVPGVTGPVGTVNQYGGTMHVTGSNVAQIRPGSVYNLSGGTLRAHRIDVYGGGVPSPFTISGGRLEVSDSVWFESSGQLQGGEVQAPTIGIVGGPFTQMGGRNTVGYLGMGYRAQAEYRLDAGSLISSEVYVGTFDGQATFNQSGGVHTNSNRITLQGVERTGHHNSVGEYVLSSGFLVSPKLNVAGGEFFQSGGTNVAVDIVLDLAGSFTLTGGSLESENLHSRRGDGEWHLF